MYCRHYQSVESETKTLYKLLSKLFLEQEVLSVKQAFFGGQEKSENNFRCAAEYHKGSIIRK